jgi:Tfp pilus assembly protein PilO
MAFTFSAYNFFILPVQRKIGKLNEKIEVKKIKLEKNSLILERKKRIEERYNKYFKNLQLRGTEEEEVATFLSEIESLAQKNSVRISDMKPRPSKKVDFYKKFSIDLEAEGDIKQITQFIYQIQSTPQLLRVDKLRLETKSLAGWSERQGGSQGRNLKSYLSISKVLIP